MNFSPVPMCILTVNGIFVSCNQLFCDLLGYSSEDELKHQPISYYLNNAGCNAPPNVIFNEQLMQKLSQTPPAHASSNRLTLTFSRMDGAVVETLQTIGVIRDMYGHGAFFVATTLQHRYLQ